MVSLPSTRVDQARGHILKTQDESLGQSEHGPSRNFVFEDRNLSGLGKLNICVFSLVVLQNGSFEQLATNCAILPNVYLSCF